MTSQLLETLTARTSPRPGAQPSSECFGKYIGTINFANHCWVAKGSVRDRFYSELKPEILRHLDGWFGSVSSEDWVTLSIYMIGSTERTASATVLFISENAHYRKEARKVIKESGILKQYSGFKTAHISQDPGWGEQLEQLAISQEAKMNIQINEPAIEVFYERLKLLQHLGMPIYVRHGSSMRAATANAIRLRGQLFYLATCHAFFNGLDKSNVSTSAPEDDFEIDSDSEPEHVDDVAASITSIGSESRDDWPDFNDLSDNETHSATSDIVSHSRSSIATFHGPELAKRTASPPLGPVNDKLAPFGNVQIKYPPQQIRTPSLDSLALLGVLVDWSIDQDWALIKVIKSGESNILSIPLTNLPDLSTARIALLPQDKAKVVAYTASCGPVTGIILGTPSYTRVPRGTSFQEVFSINLDGPLADGDCGSAVFDTATGKLFGHIVAGCRSTGFAYVMAAHHVFPKLEKSALEHVSAVEAKDKKSETPIFRAVKRRLASTPKRRAAKAVGEWRSDPPRLPPGWERYFTRRRNIDHRIENNRHVDSLAVFQGFEDAEAADLYLAGGGVLRAFMQRSTERDHYVSGIEQFCCHMSLWRLLNDQPESSSQSSIAWLDERSFATGLMRSRPYRGPLTARSLYVELKKPRFSDKIHRHSGSMQFKEKDQLEPVGQRSGVVPNSCYEADADRRLIFITDLDQWTIYALVGTASYHQASPLRDCLNRYVEFETFIDVTLVPVGLQAFQLSFHLPHYVWRRAAHGRADHRRDSNAAPLRQTIEVSYLHMQNPSDRSFLYESQISCVIAGSDKWRWVGYCFVDTFFDVGSEVRESVHSIHDDLVDGGAHMDPITYGIKDAESPIRDPREYFLTVFRLRTRQVLTEWQRVVCELRQGIRAYELGSHEYPGNPLHFYSSTQHDHAARGTVQRSRDWVVQVGDLSMKLSQDLLKTVGACENFLRYKAIYFENLPRSRESLSDVQTTIMGLDTLAKRLDCLANRCNTLSRTLELQLVIETGNIGNSQHAIAQRTRGLSVIMLIIVTPWVIAPSILNLDKEFIPFIPQRFTSLLITVLGFTILSTLIYTLLFYHPQLWNFVMGHKPWGTIVGRVFAYPRFWSTSSAKGRAKEGKEISV